MRFKRVTSRITPIQTQDIDTNAITTANIKEGTIAAADLNTAMNVNLGRCPYYLSSNVHISDGTDSAKIAVSDMTGDQTFRLLQSAGRS